MRLFNATTKENRRFSRPDRAPQGGATDQADTRFALRMGIRALLRAALILYGLTHIAQAQQFITTQPDCIIFFHFTAAAQTSPLSPNAGFSNLTNGCTTWNVSYSNTGFSAITLAFQSAPNVAGVAGSWSTFASGTLLSGINPNTNTTGTFTWIVGYNPWVRMALTAATGSGEVDGAAYGYRIPSAGSSSAATQNVDIVGPLGQAAMAGSVPVVVASNQTAIPVSISGSQSVNLAQVVGATALTGGVAGSQGVGGLAAVGATPSGNPMPQGLIDGAGNMITPDYCTSKATFTTSGSGNTQLVAVSSTTTIRVCHIDWSGDTLTIAKLVTGTGSSCTSSADETGVFTGATGGMFGFVMDYASPLKTTAAKTLCLNLSIASAGGGTIIYSQR